MMNTREEMIEKQQKSETNDRLVELNTSQKGSEEEIKGTDRKEEKEQKNYSN